MRKMFKAIGRVMVRVSCVVLGIYLAAILPLWIGAIIVVCGFIGLVLCELEERK